MRAWRGQDPVEVPDPAKAQLPEPAEKPAEAPEPADAVVPGEAVKSAEAVEPAEVLLPEPTDGPAKALERGQAPVPAEVLVPGEAPEPGEASESAEALVPATADVRAVARQLSRTPRGVRAVAHRCPCGLPDVVETAPRLPDGSPFPTLYYLTCVRACAAASRLESAGVMRQMTERLATEPGLAAAYLRAHHDYAARRDAAAAAAGVRPLPPGTPTAGGMPDRVKCLHALVAHELAVPGANPIGREAILAMGQWWRSGPCVPLTDS